MDVRKECFADVALIHVCLLHVLARLRTCNPRMRLCSLYASALYYLYVLAYAIL
jgi:hypothetical protein